MNTTYQLTFGDVLTIARSRLKQKNIKTQEEYAKFLGFTIKTISNWERNLGSPNRANMITVKEKIEPYLTPEELAVFENRGTAETEPKVA